MKKRVTKSEIELAKKSSRILFLISFMLLVLLFLGFGLLYAMDVDLTSYIKVPKKVVKEEKKQATTKEIILENTPMAVEVDIKDGNIKKFFNTVKITNPGICVDGGYVDKEKVAVRELSTKCKFSIASMIYQNDVQKMLDGKLYVKEDTVKDVYEGLFGLDSYERQESIPCLYKTNFIFGGDYYFTEKVTAEEGSSLIPYEKLIKAYRQDNHLDITSVVFYYEKVMGLFCKDHLCDNIVEEVKAGNDYGEEYLSLYAEHNKDKLYQYTYHFEMDDAGFYRYVGYERTNE